MSLFPLVCVHVPLSLDLFHECFDLPDPLLAAPLLSPEPVDLGLPPLELLHDLGDLSLMLLTEPLPVLLMLPLESVQLRTHELVVPLEQLVLRPQTPHIHLQSLDRRLLLRGQLALQLQKELGGCLRWGWERVLLLGGVRTCQVQGRLVGHQGREDRLGLGVQGLQRRYH